MAMTSITNGICEVVPVPSTATLHVIKHVINDNDVIDDGSGEIGFTTRKRYE